MGVAPSGSATYWNQFPQANPYAGMGVGVDPSHIATGTPTDAPLSSTQPGVAMNTTYSPLGVNPIPMQTTQPVTPPNGTPTQPVSGGTSGADPKTLILQYQAAHPVGTPGADVQSLVAFLKQNGINASIPTHAGGTQLSTDKIVLPDSSVWDLGSPADPGGSWSTPNASGYWVNGQPSSTPASVGFTPPTADGSGSGGGASATALPPGYSVPDQTGAYPLAPVTGPGLAAAFTTPFVAPTGTDDPGFAFAMQQGLQALDRTNAANGKLLTGGAVKDALDYSTGKALQGYGDAYNRAWQQYMGAYGIYQGNQNTLFNQLNTEQQTGLNAANSSVSAGENAATNATNAVTNQGQANAGGTIAQGRNSANTVGQVGAGLAAPGSPLTAPKVPGTV